MAQNELTHKRPTIFSAWHRTLPKRCCFADVDFAEVREGRVVCFIETIQVKDIEALNRAGEWIKSDPWLHCWYPIYDPHYPLWETKKVVMNYIIGKTDKPFYIIYHLPDMSKVKVVDYRKKTAQEYTRDDFATWLACKW
ncbi:MAG: hypothetical protein PHG35_01915 [Dehalococcoidales bacterium]|nr:hypothetical protein [Dehalococcoidales bacterium]